MLGLPYKDQRVGDLKSRNLYPHSLGGGKYEVKVSAGLICSGVSRLVL